MLTFHSRSTRRFAWGISLASLLITAGVQAAPGYVWTGAGDGQNLFTDGGNWSPSWTTLPVLGDFGIDATADWANGSTLFLGGTATINSLAFTGTFDQGLAIGGTAGNSAIALTFGQADATILSLTGNTGASSVTFNQRAQLVLNYTGAGTINVASNSTLTIQSQISGSGGLIKTGAGTLVLTPFTVAGVESTNSFTGDLSILEGTVRIGGTNALGTGTSATNSTIINGGTLEVTGNRYTYATRKFYVGSSVGTITNGAGESLRLRNTISDVAGQNGVLRKTGAGTLLIDATGASALTYTGGTRVVAGTLALVNANVILGGSGSVSGVTVSSGATLDGSGTINGNSVLEQGASLRFSVYNSAATQTITQTNAIGALTFNNNLDISGAAASSTAWLYFDLGSTASYDKLLLTSGVLTIGNGLLGLSDFSFTAQSGFGAGTYTLFTTTQSIVGSLLSSDNSGVLAGYNIALALNEAGNSLNLVVTSAVPEPATWAAIAGAGVLALAIARRARRTSRASNPRLA